MLLLLLTWVAAVQAEPEPRPDLLLPRDWSSRMQLAGGLEASETGLAGLGELRAGLALGRGLGRGALSASYGAVLQSWALDEHWDGHILELDAHSPAVLAGGSSV